MKMTLTATFDSIEEMQDWLVAQAKALQPVVPAQIELGLTEAAATAAPVEEPAPAGKTSEPKPKRKRRTKAEMEAARAGTVKEKGAQVQESLTAKGGNGADEAPAISEDVLRQQYAEAFRGALEDNLEAGIKLVKGAGLTRFSSGTLEQQSAILDALGVSIEGAP